MRGFKPHTCHIRSLRTTLTKLSPETYNPQDTLAERSKALAQGASPQGRGFEPHRCHVCTMFIEGPGTYVLSWTPYHPKMLVRRCCLINFINPRFDCMCLCPGVFFRCAWLGSNSHLFGCFGFFLLFVNVEGVAYISLALIAQLVRAFGQ